MDFLERLGDLDAATLAAPTGVNLGLYHPHLAAQFPRRGVGFSHGKTRDAAGRGHPIFAQNLLALILMNIHWLPRFSNLTQLDAAAAVTPCRSR